jgi:hypothetical protein
VLQIQTSDTWPAQAVRDTVAAIARQDAYERSFTTTLWQRIWRTLTEWLDRFLGLFEDSETTRWITIALIALLVALILARVAIVLFTARDEAASAPRQASARVRDARAEAERLAAAGRFTEAAHALLAAILASLADRGQLRLHESKTTGDYARELDRNASPLRGAFRTFRRRYDRVIYGVGECSADEFDALRRDAEPALA